MIRYCSQHIITKVTFNYTSVTKLQNGHRQGFFWIICENLFLWINVSLVIFKDLVRREPLNPQESVYEKFHLLTLHLQEWSFIYKNNFNNRPKLTFLCQLFSKFRENLFWLMKFKSMISEKIYFRKNFYFYLRRNWWHWLFWRRRKGFWKQKQLLWKK